MRQSTITIILALAGFLIFNSQALAQTNAASTEPPEANQTAPTNGPNLIDSARTLPVLFIVGDSTVHNSATGLLGWGDVLGSYFDAQKIIVKNCARPGRSSRTFQTQGWWAQVMDAARPGDFVIIQMGHNDGVPLDDTNRARGTIPGIGDDSREIYNPVMNRLELVHTYGWYMRKYIFDARAKGMTPIICSPVPRLPKATVKAEDIDTTVYVKWSEEIASEEHVYFIPLNHLILTNYIGMTPKEIQAKYFGPHENTHANPVGAALNASEVVAGMRILKDCPLQNYLLDHPEAP
jgi:rhamnogalacturonan acetylesterase